MSPHTALPRTIDEVILRLDAITEDAARTGSRAGYFAALYNRVTRAVRDGVRARAFADNARMERLDMAFANRYLAAYDAWRSGRQPTLSWHTAFAADARQDLSVLQHLFMGMNAHINLDLGIAAAEVAPGDAIHGLRDDFNRINGVLASLLPIVEAQVRAMSPSLDQLSSLADRMDNIDDRIGNFSMEKARDGAWRFALRLAPLRTPFGRELAISARDAIVAEVGRQFQEPGPLTALLGGPDGVDVTARVHLLARTEPGLAAT
ncbi:MAG: DUF5995 family protein [Vicinamibacterales bacterium]